MVKIVTDEGPLIEPVTLAEMKTFLRIDSGSIDWEVTTATTIAPGDHAVSALPFDLVGSSLDVRGCQTIVYVVAGLCGTGGSFDVKIQESADNLTWSDYTGGAFATISEANDEATYSITYEGDLRYIRAVATVDIAECAFNVSITKRSSLSVEDELIESLITIARQAAEQITNRALITQSLIAYYDEWPRHCVRRPSSFGGEIILPSNPVQAVTTVEYHDGTQYVVIDAANYTTDLISTPAKIVPVTSYSWPTLPDDVPNPVKVTFDAGYGDARTDVPGAIKQWIKIRVADMYENREKIVIGRMVSNIDGFADRLLDEYRVPVY